MACSIMPNISPQLRSPLECHEGWDGDAADLINLPQVGASRLLRHGIPSRHPGALAVGQGGFRVVERFYEFGPRALTLMLECKGFVHCVFGVLEPVCLDGLADQRFLVWAWADFHVMVRSIGRLRLKM
jgi:hypothetical protein